MRISGIPAIPMIITYLLQGTLCNTGIPRTFYGGKICSVVKLLISAEFSFSFMVGNPYDLTLKAEIFRTLPKFY